MARSRFLHRLGATETETVPGAGLNLTRADDVAYSVHDVEDGIHGGCVAVAHLLADADERGALCADVAGTYSPEPASVR